MDDIETIKEVLLFVGMMILCFVFGFAISGAITEDHVINKICNQGQYDFCIAEKTTYKYVGGRL